MNSVPFKNVPLKQFIRAALPGVATAGAVMAGVPVPVAALAVVGVTATGAVVGFAARMGGYMRLASSALAVAAGGAGAGVAGTGAFIVLTNPSGPAFMVGMGLCTIGVPILAILGTYYAGKAENRFGMDQLNPVFNATVAGITLGLGLTCAASLHQIAVPEKTRPQAMLHHDFRGAAAASPVAGAAAAVVRPNPALPGLRYS